MRYAHRKLVVLVSAFLAALGAGALSTSISGAAHAATITPLPAAYQIFADNAHGHLFISEGTSPDFQVSPTDSTILVTDLSGNPVATLPGPLGVDGMTLSPDDTTLYVAQNGGVAAFSTATLKQTGFYNIGFPAYSLVLQSGKIWVTYGEGNSSFGIGSIDPSTGSFGAQAFPATWINFPPLMSADPGDQSGTVITSTEGISPPTVASYNVSNPAAVTQIASSQQIGTCGLPNGLTVVAGGATFICNGDLLSTADMSLQGSFGNGSESAAGADGTIAVADAPGNGSFPDTIPDVFVFPSGATSSSSYKAAYTLEGPNAFVPALALSADGESLYAIIQNNPVLSDPVSFSVVATSNVVQVKNRATGKCLNENQKTGLLSTYTCLPGTYASLRWQVVTYSDGSKDLVSVQTGLFVSDGAQNQQLSLSSTASSMRFQNGGIFRFPNNLVMGVNNQGNFVPVIGSPANSGLNNVRWDFGSVPS